MGQPSPFPFGDIEIKGIAIIAIQSVVSIAAGPGAVPIGIKAQVTHQLIAITSLARTPIGVTLVATAGLIASAGLDCACMWWSITKLSMSISPSPSLGQRPHYY